MGDGEEEMLDEIAAELRAGDGEVRDWLRDQLQEAGASEVAVELAIGIIARLMPPQTDGPAVIAGRVRWLH